jgi:hypothetical protein
MGKPAWSSSSSSSSNAGTPAQPKLTVPVSPKFRTHERLAKSSTTASMMTSEEAALAKVRDELEAERRRRAENSKNLARLLHNVGGVDAVPSSPGATSPPRPSRSRPAWKPSAHRPRAWW